MIKLFVILSFINQLKLWQTDYSYFFTRLSSSKLFDSEQFNYQNRTKYPFIFVIIFVLSV